jgi:ABC-type transport system involved in cytochrome c biogenesis permease component
MNDRRLWFFLVAAVACALLVPATPGEFRWVPQALVAIYLVLAALVALETFSRRGDENQRPRERRRPPRDR